MTDTAHVIYLGVDPGKSGGIAAVDGDGTALLFQKMPDTDRDILDVFLSLAVLSQRQACLIELVHSSPQMGVTSAFTFGKGYGGLLMALTAAAIPFEPVSPRKWQTGMSCLSGGDKNVTKARAQQLFPSARITHATADALLLAEYCRRFHRATALKGSHHGQSRKEESRETPLDQEADQRFRLALGKAAERAAGPEARQADGRT